MIVSALNVTCLNIFLIVFWSFFKLYNNLKLSLVIAKLKVKVNRTNCGMVNIFKSIRCLFRTFPTLRLLWTYEILMVDYRTRLSISTITKIKLIVRTTNISSLSGIRPFVHTIQLKTVLVYHSINLPRFSPSIRWNVRYQRFRILEKEEKILVDWMCMCNQMVTSEITIENNFTRVLSKF